MSDRVEEHGTPSVYEPKDYVNIVEDDDDESSDEEGMTPQDTDEEDELSQAQSSGGRQNAERFPSRGPQTPKLVRAPEGAPTKPTVQPVVQKKTPNPVRIANPDRYRTSPQNASSSSSKDKKSNGGK